MLKECLEVFGEILEKERKKGKDIILDSYIPADGTYIFVDKDGNIKESIEIWEPRVKISKIETTYKNEYVTLKLRLSLIETGQESEFEI